MVRHLLVLAGFGVLVSVPWSPPSAELPKGVPPLIGTAVAKPGADQNTWSIELTVPKVRWEMVGKVVPKSKWPRLESTVEKVTLTLEFDLRSALVPSKVVDLKGKELADAEAQRRLKAETPVLVAVGEAMPDSYWLQLTREDA